MCKVRREQVVGIEDVKFMAINMYKYKEGLGFFAHCVLIQSCIPVTGLIIISIL